jgi:FKBP-type peptidyl-prolyl cis-trans isomerase FkpA/FKBP-type peptidyl-prolyl cis-trans isomerase FklB
MRTLAPVAALVLLASVTFAADAELKTDDDKTLYALGIALSRNLSVFNLKPAELDFVKQGLTDGVLGTKPKVEFDEYATKIQAMAKARTSASAEVEKKAATEFLEKAAAEKGAKKTASGLIITEIKPGTGDAPKATDRVKVHYHGTLRDGTVFDSSVKRGEPATFPLNGVIPCWTEGVQLMKVGGKSKLVCPSAIAYGDRGSPPNIKPGAPLVFEVELIEIVKQ